VALHAFAAARRAVAPLLLAAGRTAANPQQRRANDGTNGETGGRTDRRTDRLSTVT